MSSESLHTEDISSMNIEQFRADPRRSAALARAVRHLDAGLSLFKVYKLVVMQPIEYGEAGPLEYQPGRAGDRLSQQEWIRAKALGLVAKTPSTK